jgi:hypothetical protein
MNYLGSFYAFLTAVGFKINTLTVRSLQEKGAAKLDTYAIYRYALIPSVIWSLIFVRTAELKLIFHTPKLLIILGVIIVFWNLQAYLRAEISNSTNSMVLFSTIFNMLAFPLFLAFGTFFNHDKPNAFSLISILILLVAILIRPTPHKENLRPSLSRPLRTIVLLIFLTACCDTILQGVAREALQTIRPVVFLGIFSLPTLSICWIISKFYIHRHAPETVAMKRRQWLTVSLIPMTWFVASIPEAFALAAIPIYTFISINVLTFGMDTTSDLFHKRIRLSPQTISFLVLVIAGISLSVLSV